MLSLSLVKEDRERREQQSECDRKLMATTILIKIIEYNIENYTFAQALTSKKPRS